jgi:hypothetical protein
MWIPIDERLPNPVIMLPWPALRALDLRQKGGSPFVLRVNFGRHAGRLLRHRRVAAGDEDAPGSDAMVCPRENLLSSHKDELGHCRSGTICFVGIAGTHGAARQHGKHLAARCAPGDERIG